MNAIFVSAAAIGAIALASTARAGDLNPPAGPITGTFKTLTEIEPRTAVTQENTPGDADAVFVISEPGSYYLTGEVVVGAGFNGIEITSDDVALNLNGFTILGDVGSLDGVTLAGALNNISIRDGAIRGMGGDGIDARDDSAVRVLALTTSENGGYGVYCGADAVITDAIAKSNGVSGIKIGSRARVARSVSASNIASGFSMSGRNTLVECVANSNGSSGFFGDVLNQFINCTSEGNGGDGFRSSVQSKAIGSSSEDNGGDGFLLFDQAIVRDCVSRNDAGDGFDLNQDSSISNSTARASGGHGFNLTDNTTAENCTSNDAGLDGFRSADGGVFRGCVADSSDGDGFDVGAQTTIVDSQSLNNLGNGLVMRGENLVMTGGVIHNNSLHGAILSDFATLTRVTVSSNGTTTTHDGLGDGGVAGTGANEAKLIACTLVGNAGDGAELGFASVVSDTTASFNGEDGIRLGQASAMENCTARENGRTGLRLDGGGNVRGCVARLNGTTGIAVAGNAMVVNCIGERNASTNISVSSTSTVLDSRAYFGQSHGIQAGSDSTIMRCTVDSNAASGIRIAGSEARVDGNHVTDNAIGIEATSIDSTIVRNTLAGNSADFAVVAGNILGTIRTSVIGAGPWDNFVQ